MPMTANRVAVICHVFYPQMVGELAACILNLMDVCGADRTDLFLTFPDRRPEMGESLRERFPRATMAAVPNRGYDIAPFFEMLNRLDLDRYDFVVKLHSKRDMKCKWVCFRPYCGGAWRRALLSFCSTRKSLTRTLDAFAEQPDLGMIVGKSLVDPTGEGQLKGCGDWGVRQVAELGLVPHKRENFSGSIFIVRAKLLKPAVGKVKPEQFPPIADAHRDYGLAGEWEGAFSVLVTSQGMRISDGRHSRRVTALLDATRRLIFRNVRRVARQASALLGDKRFSRMVGSSEETA